VHQSFFAVVCIDWHVVLRAVNFGFAVLIVFAVVRTTLVVLVMIVNHSV